MRNCIVSMVLTFCCLTLFSQQSSIEGVITNNGLPLAFANVLILENEKGAVADENGRFVITNLDSGTYNLRFTSIGYEPMEQKIQLGLNENLRITTRLKSRVAQLNTVVVTGTKTFKRQTDSPVIVNVMDSKTLDRVQACNLSEGLKFQPGLRVETDCQTCNYTQLRMNGLAGSYSQILINGRPIFSPLTGLYGLEQLPVNMIDRIEVIRGGGSSLYGSSAIGGTVNVLTKIPESNSYNINYFYQTISGEASDHNLLANTSLVSNNKKSGASLFLSHRNREFYDHNGDNFSELPEIENTSFGANLFALPTENQKVELSISRLSEYRYGGEMIDDEAHLARQSEERQTDVWMGSLDYQLNFNQKRSSLIAYGAWQNTDREHYTGIFPDATDDIDQHLENPPYGDSRTTTINTGLQLNHQFGLLGGVSVFTVGSEYIFDDVNDRIEAYQYLIDQTTEDLGVFAQSDWEISKNLNLLTGLRADRHNLVDRIILSPRASLLYKLGDFTQFRLSYGSGFRAPQAFDTDLHIAFAGGGISRVQLSPELQEERSRSYSASVNFDKPTEKHVYGFTIEAFYTQLDDAFILQPIGEDAFGEVFEKRNGDGAEVYGTTLEFRINFNRKAQLESGFTIQRSMFQTPVEYIDGIEPTRAFVRTPNEYGFTNLSLSPWKRVNGNINLVYTGPMLVPHFAGAPEQSEDEITKSPSFFELNLKTGYRLPVGKFSSEIEFYGGVKNLLNVYQNDFDTGKNRDSNYIYGPNMPRTYFIGIKLSSNQI